LESIRGLPFFEEKLLASNALTLDLYTGVKTAAIVQLIYGQNLTGLYPSKKDDQCLKLVSR